MVDPQMKNETPNKNDSQMKNETPIKNEIQKKYEKREHRYGQLLQKQEKLERLISNLRLALFIMGLIIIVLTYMLDRYLDFVTALVVFTAIFIYLVVRHSRLKERIKYTTILRDINIQALRRLHGQWHSFNDIGAEFKDINHNYSEDLDIFGKASLFQWINTAQTFRGRQMLKDLFSGVVGDSAAIRLRQGAVKELAELLTWRQKFLAEGMVALADGQQYQGKLSDPQELINWGREKSEAFTDFWVIVLCRVCPVITTILVVLGFGLHMIPWVWPTAGLLIQAGLLSFRRKERDRMFNIAEQYADDIKVYYLMLKHLEIHSFKASYLQEIKDNLRGKEGLEVYRRIEKLSALMAPITSRRNAFYAFFNIIALRDFQYIIALEKWKQQSGQALGKWFDALGKIEALASLAVIRFDHPDWVMPTIIESKEAKENEVKAKETKANDGEANDPENNKPVFEALGLGHPLLPAEKRKRNDLTFDGEKKVLLITGSNMSGKSTLLRTAGISLVLAYAGAPVCARDFQASLMSIYSCMRVSDNLEEKISSFYAELLRIKRIVQKTESGERVFFLLDEVFKGTNSLDRHTGARVLIKKLSQTNALGLVSTHDLELCDLAEENKRIANYHFQEYYQEGKIYFDYQLRSGPSTTRNALYLMQLAGIEVRFFEPMLHK